MEKEEKEDIKKNTEVVHLKLSLFYINRVNHEYTYRRSIVSQQNKLGRDICSKRSLYYISE